MTIRKKNPWNDCPQVSALVPLPDREVSLFASSSGPTRGGSNDPVAIFFPGAGAPIAAYIKVQQHLSKFVRTLFHDRAGYDRSTMPPRSRESLTAEDAALDLDSLLRRIDVRPPYILIGHSYGGILAREFLQLQLSRKNYRRDTAKESGSSAEVEHYAPRPIVTDTISGLVLYDAATELALALFPRVPPTELLAVSHDVDWIALTNLRAECGMTDEEWDATMAAIERTAATGAPDREDTHGSADRLARKRQFERGVYAGGDMVVVRCNSTRDYQTLYDEGVRLGGGTEEERRRATEFIRLWGMFNYQMIRAQIDLVPVSFQRGDVGGLAPGVQAEDSANVRYIEYMDWGHDSPFRKPELVGDAVRWALRRKKKKKEKGGEGTVAVDEAESHERRS